MSASTDIKVLEHLVYSVFLPPKLPQVEQEKLFQQSVDLTLIRSVIQASQYDFESELSRQWSRIMVMLQRLENYIRASPEDVEAQIREGIQDMMPGDIFPLYIRAQNAAVIIRKQDDRTTFEVFEAQAQAEDVMSVPGKFIRHFPGPVASVPNTLAGDDAFVAETANILARMNKEVLPQATPETTRNGKDYSESHDTINPNYFIQYFLGFLGGMGLIINPPRIVKRLADDVLWGGTGNPWRRSPVWLIVRVTLQTSLDSTVAYKHFMTYYHASILSQCSKCEGFGSDLLHTMRIKMARRLYKLQDSAPQSLIDFAKSVAEDTEVLLQGRWDAVQSAQAQFPNPEFSNCDFESAINQTLPNSRTYLKRVFEGRSRHDSPPGFNPMHAPRLDNIVEFSQYSEGSLAQAFKNDTYLALLDFEASIFKNLSYWTSSRLNSPGACTAVFICFRDYLHTARSYYTVDVTDKSVMVLTLMRLWMAIDELVASECPLLLEFSPELPEDLLDPLLLRTTEHIEQASMIQKHIRARRQRASPNNASIFSDHASESSFAVQYFSKSARHQRLKLTIEHHAQQRKEEKIEELQELNMRSKKLSREIQAMVHHYDEATNQINQANQTGPTDKPDQIHSQRQHSTSCERCLKDRERSGIKIKLCEWPLPPNRFEAETVIFELHPPEPFVVWRDITYEILADFNPSAWRAKVKQKATLGGYGALTPWISNPATVKPRITLASSSGSFDKLRHNTAIDIPAREDQVCTENPLRFRFYDGQRDTWATGPFPYASLAKYGTWKIPRNSPYHHLKYAISGTTHTSNQVLADQYNCPNELSLHEHIAFGTLRSGARLQWMNILRGLEEGLLAFNSDEVQLLHAQAAWQIGPISPDGSHEWHEDLSSVQFGLALVSQCERVLDRVKSNWLQANAVLIIVTLIGRLLASMPQEEVMEAACNFLCKARTVIYQWLGEHKAKLQAALHEDILSYQYRVCEMAALCRTTYDVEPYYWDRLLSSPSDFTALIESFIGLCENRPLEHGNAPRCLQILLCRDRRFAHRLSPFLCKSILSRGNDILSAPIHNVWFGYRQGRIGWWALDAPNSRWLATTIVGANDGRMQDVHLNLLNGQLMVDGEPLGRLPLQYTEHETYARLFGQKSLEVVPANFPGMEFTTRSLVHGYQVSFALEGSTSHLIVQARKENCLYELIPHDVLSDDFPVFFSKDYHHWADVNRKTIEFRPVSSPWLADKCQWLLQLNTSHSNTLKSSADGSSLIDMHSPLFESLAQSICPLESTHYLHVIRSVGSQGRIEVQLPRMQLSFFINEDMYLESRNFREQVVDENQSAGTLFGLKNQLVLRAKGAITHSPLRSRSVLIPYGRVAFAQCDNHTSISIQIDSQRDINVYRYTIDKDLGYLATDAGLTSRLFKIYLHALTSHCLPDPLMGRTGTEEALNDLCQASTWSFAQIDLEQAKLLRAIGQLTPRREYYPKHLQCMQEVRWMELPSLSQHCAFSFATMAVLLRADVLQLFHPLNFSIQSDIDSLKCSDKLTKRATQRTTMYYPSGNTDYASRIMGCTEISDSMRSGRDDLAGDWEEAGQVAMWASGLVHQNWGTPTFKPYELVSLIESYGGLDDTEEHNTLSYHSSWFEFDIKKSWINLYNLLRQATISSNQYMVSACLASVSFGQTLSTELVPVLVAFATNSEFQSLDPPWRRTFQFEDGYKPTRKYLEQYATEATYPIESTPAIDLICDEGEASGDFLLRKKSYYNAQLSICRSQLVDDLLHQLEWPPRHQNPTIELHFPSSEHSRWLNVESYLKSAREYISSCASNVEMNEHLSKLESVLASCPSSMGTTFTRVERENAPVIATLRSYSNPWDALSTINLMRSRPAPDLSEFSVLSNFAMSRRTGQNTDVSRLERLIAGFRQSETPLNRRYGDDLDKSLRELRRRQTLSSPKLLSPATMALLTQTRDHRVNYLNNALQLFTSTLSPQTEIEAVMFIAGVWPRITPRTIIQHLTLHNRSHINSQWQTELVGYAQGFVDYQKSQRLILLAGAADMEEFHKELDLASSGDDPGVDDPDWLLVQIDGNFGARSLQRQAAQEMIFPSSDSNTVIQLNMGEGKSSVIVPIIASSLANTSRLVRVVILKPLWRQMFELLVNRLSGLANRRIYYLPFGRHIRVDDCNLKKLRDIYEECMRGGGILLAQPEHILSFKLMGIDRLISAANSADTTIATALIEAQAWLKAHTRDILDESDEILHVRYRLVYTVGEQQSLEDHPDRWITTIHLLHIAANCLHNLHVQDGYPAYISYQHKDRGRFPILRIMPDCPARMETDLIAAIAAVVIDGRLPTLSCDRLPPSIRQALFDLFTNNKLLYTQYESLKRDCSPTVWKGILLVRGLLASGILLHILKCKHYRVDYGLDLSRSLLAVPFRAKDIPSMRAEFGHPDVAVALTCLSYYYHGLTEQHLKQCFEHLFKLDNPSLEYEQWVKRNSAIPEDLRQLSGVNIKDHQQFTKLLVPNFSYNQATIDFFLVTVVFPREAKGFPEKLATSGWDLAEKKQHVMTGFSGTNDHRYLLPTSVDQADPAKQLSTNALVLNYLLQPRNDSYMCMCNDRTKPISTAEFLNLLGAQAPEVRVLLDVGAQMLDLKNEDLVRCWLNLRPDIMAAVYFNDRDELVVLPQNNARQNDTPALLSASPFAQLLDTEKCIVYLDDGHTRGTDLKLHPETRALVTLGPKVTKDRLLQGCMRMRKLGYGQSVLFAAPPEIDAQIRNASSNPIDPEAPIDAFDILRWAMLNTCQDLRHHVSQWAQQGVEFGQRLEVEERYKRDPDIIMLQKGWATPEFRSLEEMYGVLSPEDSLIRENFTQRAFDVPALRERLEYLGITSIDDPGLGEEQEREVSHEAERERYTHRPAKKEPASHSIHLDVQQFINTGVLHTNQSGIVPLFRPLQAANTEVPGGWSQFLFASIDFLQTIDQLPIDQVNDYMRPLNWVMSGSGRERVVLSPFEVNELLPRIRSSSVVRLHMYAPRISLAMLSFSDLQFYSIPSSPTNFVNSTLLSIDQLHLDLFAGQLYFSSHQDYTSLCASLGLFIPAGNQDDVLVEVESDGFVKPEHHTQLVGRHPAYSSCAFKETPIPAWKNIVERRRKGQKYLPTHVGQILHGRSLTTGDF